MGFSIQGSNGKSVQFNNRGWVHLLHRAEDYGWEPLGTIARNHNTRHEISCLVYQRQDNRAACNCTQEFDIDWHGGYASNSSQIAHSRDAKNFAVALRKFLHELRSFENSLSGMYSESGRDKFTREVKKLVSTIRRTHINAPGSPQDVLAVEELQLNDLLSPILLSSGITADPYDIACIYLFKIASYDWIERIEELIDIAGSGDFTIV